MMTQSIDYLCAEQDAFDRLMREFSITLPEVELADDEDDWFAEELAVDVSAEALPGGPGSHVLC